jgi:hypothetical protein
MSFVEPHKIKDGFIHCPTVAKCARAVPAAHDSHIYVCPLCRKKFVRRQRSIVTILDELLEVQEARSA